MRPLLNEPDGDRSRHQLCQFYDADARADMDETTRLATKIETCWPGILVTRTESITNACTRAL